MKKFKVLFLCSDNYTRSITAEFCLKDFLKKNNVDFIEVSSAWTDSSSDISKYYNTHFDRMKELNIDTSWFARIQFDEKLLKNSDLIIAMATEHQDFVQKNYKIHIPLYNELSIWEKTSVVVSKPSTNEDIPQQITNMTNHIYGTIPTLFEYISKNIGGHTPNKITLDNKPFKFTKSFLPCLVTWAEKSWASFFSICLISNLIQQWFKAIYFTAFPMAKDELLNQIWKENFYEIDKKSDLNNIPNDKSIIIKSWNQKLFQQTIWNIKNLNEYIIFIKNIEEYDESILEWIQKKQKVILSWNLDNCKSKDKILNKKRESKIIFTAPKNSDIKIPKLEKYESYLISRKISGILRLEK